LLSLLTSTTATSHGLELTDVSGIKISLLKLNDLLPFIIKNALIFNE
jgi:hypothetical protein